MDWVTEALKYGGPVFTLAIFTVYIGYKVFMSVVTPLIENNRQMAEALSVLATKLEVNYDR